jgi:hypothetical protein
MDSIDILLNKINYKFPKGYPDMSDEQDVLLLEKLIKEQVSEFSFSILKESLLLDLALL